MGGKTVHDPQAVFFPFCFVVSIPFSCKVAVQHKKLLTRKSSGGHKAKRKKKKKA
jgi:hypothetical protein